MERTLTVIGKGRTATTPNTIQIELCLKATDKNYETVSLIAVKQYNEMCDCLHKVGIAKDEIKTTDYSVTTEYEMRRNTNNTNVRTFVGYTCTHDEGKTPPRHEASKRCIVCIIDLLCRTEHRSELYLRRSRGN